MADNELHLPPYSDEFILVRLYTYEYVPEYDRKVAVSYEDDMFEYRTEGATLHNIWLAAQRRCSRARNYVFFAVGKTAYELTTEYNSVGARSAALRCWADDRVHYPYINRPSRFLDD